MCCLVTKTNPLFYASQAGTKIKKSFSVLLEGQTGVYFALECIKDFPKLARKKPQSKLSGPTSGPEFCVVWLRKRPASG